MNILDEASELINGQRAKDYGPVAENFGRIAALWSSVRGQYFSKHDVAVFMILVKVARQHDLYHRDSMVDIAGYAALDAKIYDDLDSAPPQDFWAGVDQSIVEAQEKRERDRTQKPPREWESLCEVPHTVVVKDRNGDHWDYYLGSWGFGTPGETRRYPVDMARWGVQAWDHFGPFTEILDMEQKGSK